MLKHLDIKVTGAVQGVLFRHSAKQQAELRGITGMVKNMPDGSIYLEAEGEEEMLKYLLIWCQRGSENSKVQEVTSAEGPLKKYSDFRIVD